MMRLPQLSIRQWLMIALLLLTLLILFMPMRWAVGMASGPGFSASGADGTIWSGRVHEVRLGKLSIGTVNARIRPLGLLAGRIGYRFDQPVIGGSPGLHGSISKSYGGISLEGLSGAVPVANIIPGFASAQIEFDNVSVAYSNGKCQTASGSVRARPDGQIFAVLGLDAGLLGRVSCEAGDMLLPQTSGSGMERLELRVSADGRYRASLQLQQPAAEAAPLLSMAGFASIAGGFRKTGKGRFW